MHSSFTIMVEIVHVALSHITWDLWPAVTEHQIENIFVLLGVGSGDMNLGRYF